MKIKHFSGYGSVKAIKKSKNTITDYSGAKKTKLVVEVSGNHERGLEVIDCYDAFNWLVKKFDKTACNNAYMSMTMQMNDFDVKENGLDVEHCIYTLTY